MANPMLLWFVGYSNVTSIAIVTFCFVAMALFIGLISVNGDYSSQSSLPIGIEQQNMVKVSNPFFIQFEEHSGKLSGGLKFYLSSLLPGRVFVLWGVKINPFHDLILKPGKYIRQAFMSGNMEHLQELDSFHCDKMQFAEPGRHNISLSCPAGVNSDVLGNVPRHRYPVVVFIFAPEESYGYQDAGTNDCSSAHYNNFPMRSNVGGQTSGTSASTLEDEGRNVIVGLISVIHLKDEKVPQSSHIISQYVKTSGVPIYSLQPLYMSRELNSSETSIQDKNTVTTQPQGVGDLTSRNDLPTGSCAHSLDSEEARQFEPHSSCDHPFKNEPSENVRKRNVQGISEEQRTSEGTFRCHEFSRNQVFEASSVTTEGNSSNEGAYSNCVRNEDGMGENIQFPSFAECVVCQTRRVRCALLPCRHACVCISCFKLMSRCPMCRAGIETYFLVSNSLSTGDDNSDEEEDEGDILQDIQHEAVNASLSEMWHRLNARLNELIGFR